MPLRVNSCLVVTRSIENIEFWANDLGQRLDSVAGPISYTLTVSYAGTRSDPLDDYWLSDLSDIRVRGDWSLDDTFCDVMVANLT